MNDYQYPDGEDGRTGLEVRESNLAIGDARETVEWALIYGRPTGKMAKMNPELEEGKSTTAFDPRDIDDSRIPDSAFTIVAQDLQEKLLDEHGDEIDWELDEGEWRQVATLHGVWVHTESGWYLKQYEWDVDVDPEVEIPGVTA